MKSLNPLKTHVAVFFVVSLVSHVALAQTRPDAAAAAVVKQQAADKQTLEVLIGQIQNHSPNTDPIADIGERLGRFITGKNSVQGKYYLHQSLSDNKPGVSTQESKDRSRTIGQITVRASTWPKEYLEKNKNNQQEALGKLVVLYFVMGRDQPNKPDWANKATAFKMNLPKNRDFQQALNTEQFIGSVKTADDVAVFFEKALPKAHEILMKGQAPAAPQQAAAATAAGLTGASGGGAAAGPAATPVNAGGGGNSPNKYSIVPGGIVSMNSDDLYYAGAYREDLGDRKFSFKYYPVNVDGVIYMRLAVFELRRGVATSQQLLDIGRNGYAEFEIEGQKYLLQLSNGKIILSEKGFGANSKKITTSLDDLCELQKKQLEAAGFITIPPGNPSGEKFRMEGRGGIEGAFALYSERKLSNSCPIAPDFVVVVNKVYPDGRTGPVPGEPGPEIGKIGDKYWHFEFAGDNVKIVEGRGTQPPKPDSATTTPGNPPPGPANPANKGKFEAITDAKSLQEFIDAIKESKLGREDSTNTRLTEAVRAKLRIMQMKGEEGEGFVSTIFTTPDVLTGRMLRLEDKGFKFLGLGDYVIFDKPDEISFYFSLDDLRNNENKDRKTPPFRSGTYTKEGEGNSLVQQMANARHENIAEDILRRLMRVEDPKVFKALKDGVKTYAPTSPILNATMTKKKFDRLILTDQKGQDIELFPYYGKVKSGASKPSAGTTTAAAGAATPAAQAAPAAAAAGKDAPVNNETCKSSTKVKVALDEDKEVFLSKMEGKVKGGNFACLYDVKDDKDKVIKRTLLLSYYTDDGRTRPLRGQLDLFPNNGGGFKYRNILKVVPKNVEPVFAVLGEPGKKSVTAVYQYEPSKLDSIDVGRKLTKEENCLGAVVWTGMEEGEAQEACRKFELKK